MVREAFDLVLESFKMITPTVRHMEFSKKDGSKLGYVPGQFITFHFEVAGKPYNRSYSIASIATKTEVIEITVSPFPGGPGTEFLFALNPGDSVQTTGPFGRLILKEESPKRYILVATGTGITPYRSMLPVLNQYMAKQNDLEVVVLQGVQKTQDLLYAEDFLEFAKDHPRFKFHAFYSREEPKPNSNYEHHGYVQSFFPILDLRPNEDIIYLCGNPQMIDAAFTLLVDQGFNTADIRREKYISPKR